MAELRLPRFLTDKNAEAREVAIVRFAEENNTVLKQQLNIMSQMSSMLKNIEQMMFLSLDYEKRKIALDMERAQADDLAQLENKREADNAKNQSRGKAGGGSLASAAVKLGVGGMIGAYLLGFGMELLGWGKVIGEWKDKLVNTLGTIQEKLNEWGDKLTEITGSKLLGGIVKSLLVIGGSLAGLRVVFGEKAFAPIRAVFSFLGGLFDMMKNSKIVQNSKALKGVFSFFEMLIKPFSQIGKMLGFVGEGGSLLKVFGGISKLFGVFGKLLGPIGIVISIVQGIWGAFKGFQEGYKEGGILGGLKEGFIGLIDGLVGGLVDMFADLLGWILKQLGFEELGEKFSSFNFKAFFGTIVDQVVYAFDMALWLLGKIPMAAKSIIKSMMSMVPDILQRFIPDSLKSWANSESSSSAMPKFPTPRKAEESSDSAPTATVTAAPSGPAPPSGAPSISGGGGGGAGAATSPVSAGPQTSDLGSPAAITGNMQGGAVNSAKTGGGGGLATFDQAVGMVLKHEGGYVNDPVDPGGETKYGISKRAYPKVDIKGLTVDGAKAIYKRDYWDAVGGDSLPANVRYAAFDTAVNMGVGVAKRFLKESGGDLDKFIGLRRARYAAIIQKNPKMAKYQKGWNNRLNEVAALSAGGGGGAPPATAGAGAPSAAPSSSASSGAAVATATAAASPTAAQGSGGGTSVVDARKTNVTNNTTKQAPNLSASTPVEFAPHVV
ncbi:lysozyme [Stenotrophomonas phage vB_SmaS-DLP_6]|nr:lysozyme [Stenotrophomonas phage vB_SmaS-DLP_6]